MTNESSGFNDGANLESATRRAIDGWQQFLGGKALSDVIGEQEGEQTPDGVVYEVASNGLDGDFAVVDMSDVVVDTPHFHKREVEVHMPVQGSAVISVGSKDPRRVEVGDTLAIPAGVPHFVVPGEGYVAGVLSIPGYNPDGQINVDPADPDSGINTGLYSAALSRPQA